jgi:uncharacterized protein YuzE
MKISYDPNYDIMYLRFCDGKIVDTVEVEANILIDYGPQGEIMGIEIIDASTLAKATPLHEICDNMALEKTTEKEEKVFKSAQVQRIWGSALKYLPELLEELKGVKSDEKSKNSLDIPSK